MTILFYGDPHGELRSLLRACEAHRPEAVVLLGDMMLNAPLRETLAPVFEAGIAVHFVGGNWDFHNEEWFDRLWGSHPTGDLHATFRTVGGLIVQGHHHRSYEACLRDGTCVWRTTLRRPAARHAG